MQTLVAKARGLCLLSLGKHFTRSHSSQNDFHKDAGGAQSVSQLKILSDLVYRLNFDDGNDENKRLCTVFDMICGVGSGGFIAILLCILGLTADQALEEFIELNATVLEKQGIDVETRTQALKQHIDVMLKKYKIDERMRLLYSSDRPDGCKLAVPIFSKHHVGSTCTLRNYRIRQEQPLNLTISEALLVTLATPPMFNPTLISKDVEYIGGDLALSNPIEQVITEACDAFGPEERVACLLSVGCGHPGVIGIPNDNDMAQWNEFMGKLVTNSNQRRGASTPGSDIWASTVDFL